MNRSNNRLAIVGHVKFDYNNWRGEDHTYDGAIESVTFEPQPSPDASKPEESGESTWMMHVNVSMRDSQPKPGRRSFKMSDMTNVEMRFTA